MTTYLTYLLYKATESEWVYGGREGKRDDQFSIITSLSFPLFLRSSEKEVFMYAVYLLNKDICQLRQFTGLGVSKSLFRHTLPNLKYLIDKLTEPM